MSSLPYLNGDKMANEVKITSTCRACNGTGLDRHWQDDGQGGGSWIEQDCGNCFATGEVQAVDGLVPAGSKISGDYFDDVIDELADIKEKVNKNKEVLDEIKTIVDEL